MESEKIVEDKIIKSLSDVKQQENVVSLKRVLKALKDKLEHMHVASNVEWMLK